VLECEGGGNRQFGVSVCGVLYIVVAKGVCAVFDNREVAFDIVFKVASGFDNCRFPVFDFAIAGVVTARGFDGVNRKRFPSVEVIPWMAGVILRR